MSQQNPSRKGSSPTEMKAGNTASPVESAQTFLTFRLGDEHFGMEVSNVREILDPCRITRVPASPSHMLGVINVRGITTAVMDLRLRFGLGACGGGPDTRIIILEFAQDDEHIVVGGMADAVREVVELRPSQITPAPTIGMKWRSEFVRGVTRRGDKHLIILDITRLLLAEAEPLTTAVSTAS